MLHGQYAYVVDADAIHEDEWEAPHYIPAAAIRQFRPAIRRLRNQPDRAV